MAAHVECRSCGEIKTCQLWTVADRERHTNGQDWTDATGQCDDCLSVCGPDEHSDPPEEIALADVWKKWDKAERAEREYRELDRGEL